MEEFMRSSRAKGRQSQVDWLSGSFLIIDSEGLIILSIPTSSSFSDGTQKIPSGTP
jgi:hypothetical protein